MALFASKPAGKKEDRVNSRLRILIGEEKAVLARIRGEEAALQKARAKMYTLGGLSKESFAANLRWRVNAFSVWAARLKYQYVTSVAKCTVYFRKCTQCKRWIAVYSGTRLSCPGGCAAQRKKQTDANSRRRSAVAHRQGQRGSLI